MGSDAVDVHRNQVIVRVRIGDARRAFPAILDTGHGHNLSIGRRQVERWCGPLGEDVGELDINGRPVTQYAADVRIHGNLPGRVELSGRTYPPEMPQGISVMQEDAPRPPLIGLRAIIANRLRLTIDGDRRTVTLRTKGWL